MRERDSINIGVPRVRPDPSLNISFRYGGVKLPIPDALFNARTGLVISDSIGEEQINIKSFPVCNFNGQDSGFYSRFYSFDPHTVTNTNWTAVFICVNEESDTVGRLAECAAINGSNKGIDYVSMKSGALYVATSILRCSANLYFNATGKTVTPGNPYVVCITYDKDNTVVKAYLNGTQIDSYTESTWAISLTNGAYWGGYQGSAASIFGYWFYNRLLSTGEMLSIFNSGEFPTDVPDKQYMHLNYLDTTSLSNYASIDRHRGYFTPNGSNLTIPNRDTMWSKRYDHITFSFPLKYGYTRMGNYVIPYTGNSLKNMSDQVGDIEFPASSVIHNMAESRLYFNNVTDVTIKAIFDKSNRTYWKSSIENEDHYIDAGSGYYGVWHPSQLTRNFILTHSQLDHQNHIFTGLRTSGQCITGLTKIAVYKENQ